MQSTSRENPTMKTRLAAALAAVVLGACATTPAPAPITDIAARTPELSTLSRLIGEAGLADTLRGAGPYTVFAPSNEAFKAVPAATMQELAGNKDLLRSVLSVHVVPSKVTAAEARPGNVKTVQGATRALSTSGAFVTVEDAVVTQADVGASNGVVHVIDRVLMPPRR